MSFVKSTQTDTPDLLIYPSAVLAHTAGVGSTDCVNSRCVTDPVVGLRRGVRLKGRCLGEVNEEML